MGARRLDGQPLGCSGAVIDPEFVTGAEFASCIQLRPASEPPPRPWENASQHTSRTWIQIEDGALVEGEIDDGESWPVLRSPKGEWLLFVSEVAAGLRARKFMARLARQDPEEFIHLVGGPEVLAQWALGRPAGPGTVKVTSLEAFLDLWRTDFACLYEIEGTGHPIEDYPVDLEELLGFRPGVAYRRS